MERLCLNSDWNLQRIDSQIVELDWNSENFVDLKKLVASVTSQIDLQMYISALDMNRVQQSLNC